MTYRDRDRDDRSHFDRSHDQRDFRPQDSQPNKHGDGKVQNAQPYKQKSHKYREDWTDRPRDRDYGWSRGRSRRSRSPARFEYQQKAGRLSPTPYEPAYRTDWPKRNQDVGEGEDEMPSFKDMRVDEEPGDKMRAKLEAQMAAMTKEELSFEIDLLIQSGKEAAGLIVHPAQKMMETNAGLHDGDEMDVEYGRLGSHDGLKDAEQRAVSEEEVYGPVLPSLPSPPPPAKLKFDYTNAYWPAGQPSASLIAGKEGEYFSMIEKIRDVKRKNADCGVTNLEWEQSGAARTSIRAFALDHEYEYQPVALAALDEMEKMEKSIGIRSSSGVLNTFS